MVGNVDNMVVCCKDVVHWIESGWEMVNVKAITRI